MSDSLQNEVTITLPGSEWAKVFAAISQSGLDYAEKEFLNSTIFDRVMSVCK